MEFLSEFIRRRTGEPAHIQGGEVVPYRVVVNESPWTFATDGKAAVYVRGEYGADPEGKHADMATRHAAQVAQLSGDPISLAELRAFLGEPTDRAIVTCGECDGTGQTMCPHCEQDMDCDECEGVGKSMPPYETRPAMVFGACVEVNALAFLLKHLPGDVALVRRQKVELPGLSNAGLFLLGTEDWLVLMVEVVDRAGEYADVPVFGAAAVGA